MPKLQCNVNSCSSNRKNCCCRPSIHVNGEAAYFLSDTSCKSFTENTQTQKLNEIEYKIPKQSLDINCDAHRCTHNQNHKCTANSVFINYGSVGTECAAFSQK